MTHSAAEDGPLFDQGFAVGPWGYTFAISQKTGDGFDIFTRNTTHGEVKARLTTTGDAGVMNVNPDISPEFKWVAFASAPNADANYDIYVVREDGTDLRQITDTPNINERWPSWSPDGLSLAYAAIDNAASNPNWDIYMVTSGGGNTRP